MIFYLSSQGHAATKWITDAFSLHPQVIAFHGIRSMPPVTIFEEYDHFGVPLHKLSGYNVETARNLARGLHQCAKHSGRVFGAAHTIWGLHCKEPFENLDGKFGGIIRHPIMQFHSMMNAFTPRELSHQQFPIDTPTDYNYLDVLHIDPELFSKMLTIKTGNAEISSLTEKLHKIHWKLLYYLDKKKADKGFVDLEITKLSELRNNRSDIAVNYLMAKTILSCFHRVHKDHVAFISNLDPKNIILMEKMTSDFEYFKQKFKIFTELDYPEENNEKLFKLDHGHRHTKKRTSPEEVWKSWPKEIQKIFRTKLFMNDDLTHFYKQHNYWLPA